MAGDNKSAKCEEPPQDEIGDDQKRQFVEKDKISGRTKGRARADEQQGESSKKFGHVPLPWVDDLLQDKLPDWLYFKMPRESSCFSS